MDRETIHHKIHTGLLQAIAFTLPFSIKLNNALIILCLLNWLIGGKVISKTRQAFSNPVNLLMLAFFLVHITSVLFSSNTAEAWAIAERRLPLIVFPLLVFNQHILSCFKKVLLSFCAGVTLAGLICISRASWLFFDQGLYTGFFYHKLSSAIGINAVYLSAYSVLSIIILLNTAEIRTKGIKELLICFLLLLSVLLSSKMMLFILVLYLLLHISRRVKSTGYKKLGAAGLVVICALVFLIPGVRKRFNKEFSSKFNVVTQSHYTYDTPFSGTSLRLVLWKQSLAIVRSENAWLTGVGSGDFQDKLNEKYKETGMYVGDPANNNTGYTGYGPHNQYIETLLYSGIPGLFIFILLLALQLRSAIRWGNWMWGAFAILCMLFFLSESALSTNKGIVFYALFSTLFYARSYFNSSHTGYKDDFSISI
ncbi:MAG: O-antigen ligase family protein [Bacteroidota bacterium]